MLIGWKYRERNTVVQRRDPRARIVFIACVLGAIVQVWEPRWAAVLFLIAAVHYLAARLTWQETSRFWIFAGAIAVGMTLFTLLTRQSPAGFAMHPLAHAGGLVITAESARFAAAQFLRVLSISMLVAVIPYTLNPALYGVTFHGLGLSDSLAFATDLSIRFVPSLAQDFADAADAQRARGFELDRPGGGLIGRIRHMAPLVVPVTIGAIVGAEEMVDAMDLRGFGVRQRTWYRELTWRRGDTVLVMLGVLLFAAVTVAHIRGWTD